MGGIAEMFLVSRTQERLYLRKRKSFVRIAVEVERTTAQGNASDNKNFVCSSAFFDGIKAKPCV